jgi:hypothetical protein
VTAIVPASASKSDQRSASSSARRNPVAIKTVIGSTRSRLRGGGSLTIQTLARRWPKQPAAHRFDGNGMRCTGMANWRQKHSEPVEAELKWTDKFRQRLQIRFSRWDARSISVTGSNKLAVGEFTGQHAIGFVRDDHYD